MTSFLSSQQDESEFEVVVLTNTPDILQSCVDFAPKGYNRIRPSSLNDLDDLQVQQGLIMKDLLFVLMGHEGFYVRYSEKYNTSSRESLIKGPDYKTAKHLDISLKSLTKKLVYFGKYYSGLVNFVQFYCKEFSGKILQRFCYEINQFLEYYQFLITRIEDDFKYNTSFNLNVLENTLSKEILVKMGLFYELAIEIDDMSQTRKNLYRDGDQYFTNFINNIQNDLRQTGRLELTTDESNFIQCKGGLVLQMIQKLANNYLGDQLCHSFLTDLFDNVSEDYVHMLNDWLIKGELDDPFNEFFIKQNIINQNGFINIRTEKYWDELFVTRTDGIIEQFSDSNIQHKILSTGKFLNIFKFCTKIESFETLDEFIEPINKLSSGNLELKIQDFYSRANRLILQLFFDGYRFIEVVDSLQTHLLLKDSFNIDNFITRSFNDLRRNKHAVSPTKLGYIFSDCCELSDKQDFVPIGKQNSIPIDDIIRFNQKLTIESKNFYELAKEILDVKSFDAEEAIKSEGGSKIFKALLNQSLEKERNQLQSSDSNNISLKKQTYDPNHSDEYTVSGLNLEIKIPFPLNLMITQNFVFEYQLMFKLLVLSKFISKLVDNTWKEINYSSVWNYQGFHPKIKKLILRSRILHSRVNNFMKELHFYIDFDIIESNFRNFKHILMEIEISLKQKTQNEDINSTNSKFGFSTSTTQKRGFLTNNQQFDTYNQVNNSIFDRNIQLAKQGKIATKENGLPDCHKLHEQLSFFLNSLLRDSFITNKDLIDSLKNMFDIIISLNHYFSRLKKSFVLLDEDLFLKFSKDYPDKFNGKNFSDETLESKLAVLNENLNSFYELFNDELSDFIKSLKSYGEVENSALLILVERLEKSFPST